MSTADRMGGFIQARIIDIRDIAGFTITGGKVKIALKEGKSFFIVPAKKEGISPVVSVSNEKSGRIFQIDLTISLNSPVMLKMLPFNKMIAICKNPMGQEFVFGTPTYPITSIVAPAYSDRAEGSTGDILTLRGNQTCYPLTLDQ